MSAFPSETFADRSAGEIHRFSLPVETSRTSRFSSLEYPRMHRFSDSAVFVRTLPVTVRRTPDMAFSLTQQDRHTEVVPCSCVWGGSSMAGLRYPSHGRSRQSGHPGRPSAEGRSCWLNLLRKILSFSIPNRFYPGTLCPKSASSQSAFVGIGHGKHCSLR